jgi:hypothetical protein
VILSHQFSQIDGFGKTEEWAVSSINTHHGKGTDALFELTWKSGDCAWLPYHEISHLEAFTQYLEAQGITKISQLLRQIAKNHNLPIGRILTANHTVLRELVSDVINSLREYATQNSNANQGSDRAQGSAYKGQCSFQVHNFLTCRKMSDTEDDLARYTAFGNLIKSSQYVLGLHTIPEGYLEFNTA